MEVLAGPGKILVEYQRHWVGTEKEVVIGPTVGSTEWVSGY